MAAEIVMNIDESSDARTNVYYPYDAAEDNSRRPHTVTYKGPNDEDIVLAPNIANVTRRETRSWTQSTAVGNTAVVKRKYMVDGDDPDLMGMKTKDVGVSTRAETPPSKLSADTVDDAPTPSAMLRSPSRHTEPPDIVHLTTGAREGMTGRTLSFIFHVLHMGIQDDERPTEVISAIAKSQESDVDYCGHHPVASCFCLLLKPVVLALKGLQLRFDHLVVALMPSRSSKQHRSRSPSSISLGNVSIRGAVDPPDNSPVDRPVGLSLLQQVRGLYLSIHYDVPTLLSNYVRLLDQLGVMCNNMRTCKYQCRMLVGGHSALYSVLQKLHVNSSATRANEMRFAGGLELAWHALQPLHGALQEWVGHDDMESWFRHAAISEALEKFWKVLDSTFVEVRDELGCAVEPFMTHTDSVARVYVVPGQAEISRRQVVRADELEHPKLFKSLVAELDSATSLLFMKPVYIEDFMDAMQKEMNSFPAKSQTYKLYDERIHQLYERSKVPPPVIEFDTDDIRKVGASPTFESPPGSVWRGRTTTGDLVSVKVLSAFSKTEHARDTLISKIREWNRLRHPNLQRVLGIWYPMNARDGTFSLVARGIKRGDAVRYIQEHPDIDRVELLFGVAMGLSYLHEKGVPHGDLRGLNVLMRENGEPCLSNFGLMHALEVGCNVHTAMALLELGSVRWMAPEIYDAELVGRDRGIATSASDCHSFGMLILELYSGEHPFAYINQDPVVVIELVRGGRPIRPVAPQSSHTSKTSKPVFRSIDDSLWSICEACWAFPPERRLSIGELANALRARQISMRLEEARSRVGGNLLTLAGPPDAHEFAAIEITPWLGPGTPVVQSPKPLRSERGTSKLSKTSRDEEAINQSPPLIEYATKSLPTTPRTQKSTVKEEASPIVEAPPSPFLPPGPSLEPVTFQSDIRIPTVDDEHLEEFGGQLVDVGDILAEAQELLDAERSVLDQAQRELDDARDALVELDEDENVEKLLEARSPRIYSVIEDESQITFKPLYSPPTQDDPSPRPSSGKSGSSAPTHATVRSVAGPVAQRVQSASTSSAPSMASGRTSHGKALRKTPRASMIESVASSSSTNQSPEAIHRTRSPVSIQRVASKLRSDSSQSAAQSQHSGRSRSTLRTARSPKHPDLARNSQFPLLGVSMTDLADPNGGAHRLSTIPDVTDGEEAMSRAAERHAEDEELHDPTQDSEFLRLVQHERRHQNGEPNGGTFVPPSRSIINGEGHEENTESSMPSSGPPHQFPPAPEIVPTPLLFVGRDLPPLPPSSVGGGSQWFQDRLDEDDLIRAAAGNAKEVRSPSYKNRKRSDDSVLTAIPIGRATSNHNYKSPYMHTLPLSSIGIGSGSETATSQSVPSTPRPVNSSEHSAQGSKKGPRDAFDRGSRGSRVSKIQAGNKTNSNMSSGERLNLTGVGEATCTHCGRVFSSRETLERHVLKQGGQCLQRSLKQDLDYVGAQLDDDEL